VIGQVLDSFEGILTVSIGTAVHTSDRKLAMTLVNGYNPCVHDERTGKTWILEWPAIVDLAVREIDLQGEKDAPQQV
jgi:hypothetical protein